MDKPMEGGYRTMAAASDRTIQISFRVAPDVREQLKELAGKLSTQLGTKVTLTQALEIAINEATQRRKED